MSHVWPLKRHRQFGILTHGMTNRSQLCQSIEVVRFDDERVSFPVPTRIAEPRWRPVLPMWHSFGVHDLKHRALLEVERNVFVVLDNLHWMRRKGPEPAKRHATAGI